MSVRYRESPPPPALAGVLECVWRAEGEGHPPDVVVPDGCPELVVQRGARTWIRIGEHEVLQPRAALVGALRTAIGVRPAGRVDTVGLRFRPGMLGRALGLPARLLTDRSVDLESVLGSRCRSAVEELVEVVDGPGRDAAVEQLLGTRPRTAEPALDAAVREILAHRGRLRLGGLRERLGVGERRLERAFAAHVGLSPRAFASVVRVQSVLRHAGPGRGWAELAAHAGYFDQAHLAREFRAVAGLSPRALAARLGPLSRHFLRAERLDGLLGPEAVDVGSVQDGGTDAVLESRG